MVIKLSGNQDKKIAQVCQAKNSGRNQQICEQCVFKKMIWKATRNKTKRKSGLPEREKPE